jgi:hypothetical protein
MKTSEEPDASAPEWATIEQVFAALESPLLAYARRLLGDFAVAEDVVQDAFMKLHSQFHQVRTPQPWLYRAVHNHTPSLPDASPRSDRFRCGGRESDFLAVGLRSGIACWAVRREFRGRSLRSGVIGDVHTFDWMGASRDRMLGVRSR